MSGKRGMKHYSRELKREAIRLYLEEGKPQAEIIEELEINNVRRVKQWLHKYRQDGEKAFEPKPGERGMGRPPKRENTETYIARLEMENDLLKKFRAELRKLAYAKRNIGLSTTRRKHTK